MKIKYIRARNFLSVGEEAIEVDFTKMGNIVNIKGRNLDAGDGASNGAGKSTIIEALVYGLYGKLIKGLSHKEAINIRSKKGLEVEVHWDDYKVIRRRAPDRLQLWKGDKEISLGGIPATDELIRSIVKLNHNSFINIACFGQHNSYNFLSCNAIEKRQIAENLLNLDKYLKFNKQAKDKHKSIKEKISQVGMLFQQAMQAVETSKRKHTVLISRREQWRNDMLSEISSIESRIRANEQKLVAIKNRKDVQDYDKVQEELTLVEQVIEKKDKSRAELHAIMEQAEQAIQKRREEKQELAMTVSSWEREIAGAMQQVAELEKSCDHARSQKGGICSHCYGDIDDKNVRRMMERDIEKIKQFQLSVSDFRKKQQDAKDRLDACNASLDKLTEGRKAAREKETSNLNLLHSAIEKKKQLMKTVRPDAASEIMVVERDIQNLRDNLEQAQNQLESKDPYADMMQIMDSEIKESEDKVEVHRGEVKSMETMMPYYNFWVKAFGDDGIRAFVIDEIIPALNARINYWLQFLMDGRIQLHFNNQLDEVIERNPVDQDPFVYAGLSGGEHTRIDLAISQAFAHVMMLTSGTCPSLVFLDEVAAHVDRPGVQALYKMICELSRDRQVIVISHDPDLLDLLSGYETIEVVMKNGLTTIRK